MALKYFCDVCLKEAKDQDFVCEITLAEMREVYDVTSLNLNPKKQMRKQQFQICKDCFQEHFSKYLKYDK